jgi:hypothetical protein
MSARNWAVAPKTKPNADCWALGFLISVIVGLMPWSAACVPTQKGISGVSRTLGTMPTATALALSISKPPLSPSATQPVPSRSTPTVEESTNQILNLLNSDNLCDLPCFWSVTPGETWIATQERLKESVVYISNAVQNNGDILHEIPSNVALARHGITFNIAIRERAGVVDSVTGTIASARFIDTLKPLTPQQVVLTYGVPTSVRLFVSIDDGVTDLGYFHLWVSYADKGFYVLYVGYAPSTGAAYEICPSAQHFELSPAAASAGYTAQYGEVAFGSVLTNNKGALETIAKGADGSFAQSQKMNDVSTL